jgi:hypothetical protein
MTLTLYWDLICVDIYVFALSNIFFSFFKLKPQTYSMCQNDISLKYILHMITTISTNKCYKIHVYNWIMIETVNVCFCLLWIYWLENFLTFTHLKTCPNSYTLFELPPFHLMFSNPYISNMNSRCCIRIYNLWEDLTLHIRHTLLIIYKYGIAFYVCAKFIYSIRKTNIWA